MKRIYNSRLWMGIILLCVVVVICFTFPLRREWWDFTDVFFFFMAAFTQFMALTLGRIIPQAGGRLSVIALVCFLLGVAALCVEALIWIF